MELWVVDKLSDAKHFCLGFELVLFSFDQIGPLFLVWKAPFFVGIKGTAGGGKAEVIPPFSKYPPSPPPPRNLILEVFQKVFLKIFFSPLSYGISAFY